MAEINRTLKLSPVQGRVKLKGIAGGVGLGTIVVVGSDWLPVMSSSRQALSERAEASELSALRECRAEGEFVRQVEVAADRYAARELRDTDARLGELPREVE